MKILLVGEYNRAHRNIKLGLEELGHTAKVVGLTDGFKKVKVDVELKNNFESGLLKKLRVLCVKLFNVDLLSLSLKSQINSKQELLSGFDIVQFINEAPFICDRKSQQKLIQNLIEWNNNPFLLSCGTDYISVKYAYDKKYRYSILTPYFEKKGTDNDYMAALGSLTKAHTKLHTYLLKKIKGIIANDLDYHIPLLNHPKYLGMIPHAIDLSNLSYQLPVIKDKVVIFHGINNNNYYKKGNDIFEQALELVSRKYSEEIKIIIVRSMPYKQYIESFESAHIVLDQVYAYDQGYNALEAMAKGKIVFTGAEQEWLDHYNVEEDTIAINALPNAEKIAEKLEWLILNPEKIIEISKRGRKFVEQHHDHVKCAKSYLKKWSI